ncbi:uncharacterized protein LOC129914453 [Episyrphus balteatus]|uniref:uncharacterized protein LOC129914453 n=1 Tax=Episyrphus balteatus TaxID=286459 RepID=UPI0024857548|nr:uncharacterized protein LOC129914453 [Episyrphus balteatus]
MLFMEKNSRKNNLDLIRLVKSHECLWNCKNLEYFNKSEVENAWKEISEALDESTLKIQQRWKTIRGMYSNNLLPTKRKNKYKAYYLSSYLGFLRPFIKNCCKSKHCEGIRNGRKSVDHKKQNSKNDGNAIILIESSDEDDSMLCRTKVERLEADKRMKIMPKEINKNEIFLESLLPFVDEMTKDQILRFRLKVLKLVDNILNTE